MRHDGIRESPVPLIYAPQLQELNPSSMVFLVRAAIPTRDVLRLMRHEVAAIDPRIAITHPQTVEQRIDRSIFQDRMLAVLSVSFGVLALILAAIGLYGVVAFVVTRRTAEIGVRIALGAPPRRVLWMVFREALLLTGIGVVIGAPASLAAGRMARSVLFGVTPDDPRVIAAGILTLFVIGACAALAPARRAAAIDPMRALRSE